LANAPDDAIFDFETSIAPEVDVLLGAIRVSPRRIADFSEHAEFLQLLRDRLAEKEEKLKANLEKVNWEIDSEATLLAVAGPEPLETVRIHEIAGRPTADSPEPLRSTFYPFYLF
jgi:hypothetical protein